MSFKMHKIIQYFCPIGFVTPPPPPPSFDAVSCFVCGRRRVAVIQHRMVCLVYLFLNGKMKINISKMMQSFMYVL